MDIYYYEAPNGLDLPGLVDPVDLPTAYRVVARPNTKSIHGMAGDLLKSCGISRNLHRKSAGSDALLGLAAAWGLARGITDVYLGEAQDMLETNVLDTIEFAHRFGATIHFIFAYGETHTHAERITRYGGQHRPYADLPAQIRDPANHPPRPDLKVAAEDWNWPDLPAEEWMTYRATYLTALTPNQTDEADNIYRDAYQNTLAAAPTDPAATCELIGRLWKRHGFGPFERNTVVAATQAALWTQGIHTKVDPNRLYKYVRKHVTNAITSDHYKTMRAFPDPWRAAATVLHAHRLHPDVINNIPLTDVTRDGQIPSLGITLPPDAALIIAAQRWRQLLLEENQTRLIEKSQTTYVRQGIKYVISELQLPLADEWLTSPKPGARPPYGITTEAYQ